MYDHISLYLIPLVAMSTLWSLLTMHLADCFSLIAYSAVAFIIHSITRPIHQTVIVQKDIGSRCTSPRVQPKLSSPVAKQDIFQDVVTQQDGTKEIEVPEPLSPTTWSSISSPLKAMIRDMGNECHRSTVE
jgi:hypothetical protein